MNKQNCLKSIHGYKVEHIIISRVEQFIDKKVVELYVNPFYKNDITTLKKNFEKKNYEEILKRLKQFEKYKTIYDPYIDMSYNAIAIIQRAYLNILGLETKDSIIQNLKDEIKNIRKPKYGINISTGLKADIEIDMKYALYIMKYGIPNSGIFDPKKLAEFL